MSFQCRLVFAFLALLFCHAAYATVFGNIRGVVHDPSHRPMPDAEVNLRSATTEFSRIGRTTQDGQFEFSAVPVGEYRVIVRREGFSPLEQSVIVTSGSAPVLRLDMQLTAREEAVEVLEMGETVNPVSSTPTSLIGRGDIARTPGADFSNSLAMITNYVPGAYVTHDQLHIRGGHQVTWAIDGVPIPNTNIASNVGPQIDPKDIDYLEAQRGGYSSEYGDRAYGVFNVVPRSGFERNNEGEFYGTFGTFHQTNDQLNFGSHTERFAYYVSVNGNRSDYGLETPGPQLLHDRVWGAGGFASLLFNVDPSNQIRFVTSLRRDDYQAPNGPSDVERERDALAEFTWAHSLKPGALLTLSPFYHFNRANFDGDTVQHRASWYAGAQISLSAVTNRHNARIGVYGFSQRDDESVKLPSAAASRISTGHLEAGFLEDQWKATSWLTLTGGMRLTNFTGAISEQAVSPRAGAAVRIPRLGWVLHGFYGSYYQAPPLSTVSGSVLDFAAMQGLGILPLKGERNRENQIGLAIPWRGWTLDANSFRLRAKNYFDHNAIGNSNVFFPLSIAGARIAGWELAIRSPRLKNRGDVYLTYSHQRAEGQGAITGGLTNFSPPSNGYFLLDHDQRHTLHAGFNASLPKRSWASGSLYYGSGFSDGGNPGAHLQPHTTFDLSLGKTLRENISLSVTALNLLNRRFLLDNSPTFGGTHYADPRQIYVQLRYRFRY
jgi:outer membrane receptor for ferrienterochelin and colicin